MSNKDYALREWSVRRFGDDCNRCRRCCLLPAVTIKCKKTLKRVVFAAVGVCERLAMHCLTHRPLNARRNSMLAKKKLPKVNQMMETIYRRITGAAIRRTQQHIAQYDFEAHRRIEGQANAPQIKNILFIFFKCILIDERNRTTVQSRHTIQQIQRQPIQQPNTPDKIYTRGSNYNNTVLYIHSIYSIDLVVVGVLADVAG